MSLTKCGVWHYQDRELVDVIRIYVPNHVTRINPFIGMEGWTYDFTQWWNIQVKIIVEYNILSV